MYVCVLGVRERASVNACGQRAKSTSYERCEGSCHYRGCLHNTMVPKGPLRLWLEVQCSLPHCCFGAPAGRYAFSGPSCHHGQAHTLYCITLPLLSLRLLQASDWSTPFSLEPLILIPFILQPSLWLCLLGTEFCPKLTILGEFYSLIISLVTISWQVWE